MSIVATRQKEKPNNKNTWDVTHERDAHRATIRNLGTRHKVEIFWGENEAMSQDEVVRLRIGGHDAYISVEELLRYTRWAKG